VRKFPSSSTFVSRLFASGVILMLLSVAENARGQALVFPNFVSTTGLTINSAATQVTSDGTVMHIADNTRNDRGSFFSTTTRNVASFSTSFQFRLSNRGGTSDGTASGGDGFVFVIQRAGNTALSTSNGESLGYLGIGSSIGIEFDTFQNASRSDPSSNHIGIDTAGSVNSLATVNVATDFDNSNLWTAWIDYNGSTLEVRANETGIRPGSALLSYSLSNSTLSSILGATNAFVGFTASTGGAWADHDIIKWTFSDTFVSGGVTAGQAIPEPATYAGLAGLIALGIAAGIRRRQTRSLAAQSAA
jgi:hypothetical protein